MDVKDDAKVALADVKGVIAKLESEPAKIETSAKAAIAGAKGWLIATAIAFLLLGIAIGRAHI